MKTNAAINEMPRVKEYAFELLKSRWGNSSNLTRDEARWLAEAYGEDKPVAAAVEMALKLSGLWDKYLEAGLPTWAAFRIWIKEQAI